jgi:poly-beta-1,6-N-acetyl-D-glucosamine synthase
MKDLTGGDKGKRYVLATAAYNEERLIEKVIKSVICQTCRPLRWVIVSDGSTDGTDRIVSEYAAQYNFIHLHRITESHPRNFVAQVHSINAGFARLWDLEFEFIGNLDADITLEPDYFANLLGRFDLSPCLGLSGGYIYEEEGGTFKARKGNSPESVAHAVQLFRRECLEQLGGGYAALPYGGPDWHAEVRARMCQWAVEACPELMAYHHRPTGAAEGSWNCAHRMGLMDYSLGTHPLFEFVKIARRIKYKPYSLASALRFLTFILASLRRDERCVSQEFVQFLRMEQIARLKEFLGFGARRKDALSAETCGTRAADTRKPDSTKTFV